MSNRNLVVGISLAVIVTILIFKYMSSKSPDTPESRVFMSKVELDLVVKTIIDELEDEVEEAVPSQLKPNTDGLTLTDEDEGELLALLNNNISDVSIPIALGATVSLPGINTKALNSSLEKKRIAQVTSVNKLQETFNSLEKQMVLHNNGKKKLNLGKRIKVIKNLKSTSASLTKAKSSLNSLIKNIAKDNKKRNDAAKAIASAAAKMKANIAKAAATARAAAAAKAKAISDAKAKAASIEKEKAELYAKIKAAASAKAKAEAQQKAKEEADAKAKSEAAAKAAHKEKALAKSKLDAAMRAKSDADKKSRADASAKLRADAMSRSREAEKAAAKGILDVAIRAKADAEAKAKSIASAKMKAEADAKAKTAERDAEKARIYAKLKSDEVKKEEEKKAFSLRKQAALVVAANKKKEEDELREKREKEDEKKMAEQMKQKKEDELKKKEASRLQEKMRKVEEDQVRREAKSADKEAVDKKVRDEKVMKVEKARLNFEKAQASKKSGDERVLADKKIAQMEIKDIKSQDDRKKNQESLEKKAKGLKASSDALVKRNEDDKTDHDKKKEGGIAETKKEIVRLGGIGETIFKRVGMMSLSESKLMDIRKYASKRSFDTIIEDITHVISIKRLIMIGKKVNFDFEKTGTADIDFGAFETKTLGDMLKALQFSKGTNQGLIETIELVIKNKGVKAETEEEALVSHEQETINELIRMGGVGEKVMEAKTLETLPVETLVKLFNYSNARSFDFSSTLLIILSMKLMSDVGVEIGFDLTNVHPSKIDFEQFDHNQLAKILGAMRYIPSDHEGYKIVKRIEVIMKSKNDTVSKEYKKQTFAGFAKISGFSFEEFSDIDNRLSLSDETLTELKDYFDGRGLPDMASEMEDIIRFKVLVAIGLSVNIDFRKTQLPHVDLDTLDIITLSKLESYVLSIPSLNRSMKTLPDELKRVRERKSAEALENRVRKEEEKKIQKENDMYAAEDARVRQKTLMEEESKAALEREQIVLHKKIEERKKVSGMEKERLRRKQVVEMNTLVKENEHSVNESSLDDTSVAMLEQNNTESVMALETLHEAELNLIDTDADIAITNLEETKNIVEEKQLDIEHEIQNVEIDVVAPLKPRVKKTGLVKASIKKNDNGSSVTSLNVPSDLSPGESDNISLFVSKEGAISIEDYHVIYKKIKKDKSLKNVTLEEKETIASAGAEFNRISQDYIRQRGENIASRQSNISIDI